MLTCDRRRELNRKRVKAIAILQATVKDVIIPMICRYEEDPHSLWIHLKKCFESCVVQRKLILMKGLLEVRMPEGGTIELYYK